MICKTIAHLASVMHDEFFHKLRVVTKRVVLFKISQSEEIKKNIVCYLLVMHLMSITNLFTLKLMDPEVVMKQNLRFGT